MLARADGEPATPITCSTRSSPKEVDNGAAVQWDQYSGGLRAGQSASFEVAWRFARTYDLTPERQALTTGDTAAFTVATSDTTGRPQANVRVRWAVIGTNNTAGDVRTGSRRQGERSSTSARTPAATRSRRTST